MNKKPTKNWKLTLTGVGDDYTYCLELILSRRGRQLCRLFAGIPCNNEREQAEKALKLAGKFADELDIDLTIDKWTAQMIEAKEAFHRHSRWE